MKQFHIIGGHTFCITAVLFLALSPLFHGLHLASRHHPHRFCKPIHSGRALCVHLCCHAHDPSACPICQTFARLVKGQLLPFSQVDIKPQNIQLKEPEHDQAFTDRSSFISGCPRAPPVC